MMHTNDAQTVHTCQTRSVCKPRPQLIFEAGLVFKARLVFEEIWYLTSDSWRPFGDFEFFQCVNTAVWIRRWSLVWCTPCKNLLQ